NVTQIDIPDPVFVGSNLTYSITFTNKGPWPATGILLTNAFSSNATFITATQSLVGDYFLIDDYVLLFEFYDPLPVNGRATVAVVVSPFVTGMITNQIGVWPFEVDLNSANNTSSIATLVNPQADLSLATTATPP